MAPERTAFLCFYLTTTLKASHHTEFFKVLEYFRCSYPAVHLSDRVQSMNRFLADISLVFIVVCCLSTVSPSMSLLHSHTQGDKGLPGAVGPLGPVGRPGPDGHAGPMGPKVKFQPGSRGSYALTVCTSPKTSTVLRRTTLTQID